MSVDDFAGAGNRREAAPGGVPLPLPEVAGGIALWWVALDAPQGGLDRFAASLSDAEHLRAARFGTELLRARYVVGRSVLRRLLGALLDVAPHAVPIRRGTRGRPELAGIPGIDFNVSHTQGCALVGIAHAIATGARIGVDVERADRDVGADRLARKFLTAGEAATLAPLAPDARRQRFLRQWTCKEAMSKATGDGLAAPFRHLEVQTDDGLRLVDGPPPYLPAEWALHAVPVPAGHLATLAIWKHDRHGFAR